MDMVNDGKDTRLDTPQAVKEALASGKDLYNPQTGEFWWEYNDTGSIANTYIYLDDPNLLAVIDNPDFDLFEDIVGWLNYTGRIADSPDYYAENADDYPDAPDYDERDAVFAQIASEDGWLRMVVSAADSLSRHYIEMGSNPVTEEEALEFIENCSKYPSYVIPGLDMPWEEYGPFGKVANDGRALEIINTLKRSSLATSLDDHPQGVSLKQAAMEAREASAKLFDKNVGADSPTRRDER